jgi:hypothetical protein
MRITFATFLSAAKIVSGEREKMKLINKMLFFINVPSVKKNQLT